MSLNAFTTRDSGECRWRSPDGWWIVVELGDLAVAGRVVVFVSTTTLPASGSIGTASIAERDGHDGGRSRSRRPAWCRHWPRAELRDQVGEGLGSARVAEHDLVAGRERDPGDRAADVTRADGADDPIHVHVRWNREGAEQFRTIRRTDGSEAL